MQTKARTVPNERFNRYRQTLLDYVSSLPLNEIVEESDIAPATELIGHKVPKMFVRGVLNGVAGIDQEILKKGKVCRTGTVETGSGGPPPNPCL